MPNRGGIYPSVYGESLSPSKYAHQGATLKKGDLLKLANAHAFAAGRGKPLNAFLTLHWELAGYGEDADHQQIHDQLISQRLHHWLTRHHIPVAFIWVREKGLRKGVHTHLHLHLPREQGSFKPAPEWMSRLGRFLTESGRFQLQPGRADFPVVVKASWTEEASCKLLRYLGKNLDPTSRALEAGRMVPIAGACGIRPELSLPVPGKLCGASKSIGPSARRKVGWREMTSLTELRRYLPLSKPKGGNE